MVRVRGHLCLKSNPADTPATSTSARSVGRPGEDRRCDAVDVRTAAEWAYVGVPVLSSIGKQPLLVEWDEFPVAASWFPISSAG